MAYDNKVRIIAGAFKGRRLEVMDLQGLRPTTERVRETVFNWLGSQVVGATVLDLFAGSGALGLEALSRGATEVTLVEKEWPYFLSNGGLVTVLYPMSQLEEFPVDLSRGSYYFYIMASDHQQAEQDIKDLLGKQQLRPGNLFNNAEYDESNRNLITIINVFSYGFIALISLVAMTNVFNTISTNVMLRTRDFAMLQSVGMTAREMRRMLGFECILYGTRALILGIPVSIFLSYLIFDAIAQGYPLPFQVPWIPLGIACLSVFLVVFATMAYAARKVGKQQLVEALKNENL